MIGRRVLWLELYVIEAIERIKFPARTCGNIPDVRGNRFRRTG